VARFEQTVKLPGRAAADRKHAAAVGFKEIRFLAPRSIQTSSQWQRFRFLAPRLKTSAYPPKEGRKEGTTLVIITSTFLQHPQE